MATGKAAVLDRPMGTFSSPQTSFILKVDTRPSIAVLHEPLGVAAHAVRKAQPKLGSTIVVQGSGTIGLFTLGLTRLAGATRAIVVGGPPERLWNWPRRLGPMSPSISMSCVRPRNASAP